MKNKRPISKKDCSTARWKVESDKTETWDIEQTWLDTDSDSIDLAVNAVMDAMHAKATRIVITRVL